MIRRLPNTALRTVCCAGCRPGRMSLQRAAKRGCSGYETSVLMAERRCRDSSRRWMSLHPCPDELDPKAKAGVERPQGDIHLAVRLGNLFAQRLRVYAPELESAWCSMCACGPEVRCRCRGGCQLWRRLFCPPICHACVGCLSLHAAASWLLLDLRFLGPLTLPPPKPPALSLTIAPEAVPSRQTALAIVV